jgi:hypothetical protein
MAARRRFKPPGRLVASINMSRGRLKTVAFDERLEQGIEWLIFLSIGIGAFFFGGVRPSELAVMTGCIGLAALLWIIRVWLNPSHRFLMHPVLVPIIGFVGYAVWRTGEADVAYVARQDLWLVMVYATAFLIALHNLHGQDSLQRASNVLTGIGSLLALYAVAQYLSQSDSVLWLTRPVQYLHRAGSTFVNPNHFAAMMVALMPLALAQTFLSRTKGPIRVFHGYAASMMAAGLAVSMSRGGWLAGGIALLVFFLWLLIRRRQMRIPALAGLAVTVIGASLFLVFSSKAQQRIEGITAVGTADSGNRTPLWKPAIAMLKEHPWTGVGPGHYDIRFPQYRDHTIQVSPGYAHNEYLNTLADYGLIGGIICALGVVSLVGGIMLSRKYVERGPGDLGDKGSNRTAFFLGSSIGMGGVAVHSAGDFLLHVPVIGLLVAVVCALLASTARFASERWWLSLAWWSRILVTVAIAAALTFLAPITFQGFREGHAINKAAKAGSVTPRLLEDLKAAAALAPDNPRTAYEIGENLRRLSFQGDAQWREQALEAVDWLQKAASINRFDPLNHLALGLSWHWLGEAKNAQNEFQLARDLGPNLVSVANHYAWNLLTQGRVSEAKEVFEQSLTWNSWDNWFARRYLDDINRGRWIEATPEATQQ